MAKQYNQKMIHIKLPFYKGLSKLPSTMQYEAIRKEQHMTEFVLCDLQSSQT
jgi:hypothetical protein